MKHVECPNGCRRDFLQFRYWEGTIQPILKKDYEGALNPRWSGVLYCSDCAEEFIVTKISNKAKEELEKLVRLAQEEWERIVCEHAERVRRAHEAFEDYCERREAAA